MAELRIYCDGSCPANPGPGGWAWAHAPHGAPHDAGAHPHTTNQAMEILAATQAVRAHLTHPGAIVIVSDSAYVVNCLTKHWWRRWQTNGWRNAQGKPVANQALWEALLEVVHTHGDVRFEWCRGHDGDPMNEFVDRLAGAQAGRGY